MSMRRILLVEPPYRNKYPPLGLMKISTYHKLKGDYVQFVKGNNPKIRQEKWDRVYISTLFTFFWKTTLETIYYYRSVCSPHNIYVGGVMATLLGDDIEKDTGVTVIRGLINKPGILDPKNKYIVDELTPDYKILDDIDYDYGLRDAYLGYATRGCPNNCGFCAVSDLEPTFVHYLPLKKQIRSIEEIYVQKQDLVLMDNNVLASDRFTSIINEIINLGFYRGAKFNGKLRRVDFNQGVDARLLTPEKAALFSKIAINPLRVAFDHFSMNDLYKKKIKLAASYGLLKFSNYVLYNYTDTPQDFYERLRIGVLLNRDLGTHISSFPMKYIPLDARDRSYVGKHWNRQILRGIQCILLVTRGMVSPRLEFFEAAFGHNADEFLKIALMPEEYIIYRRKHEQNGALEWRHLYEGLTNSQRQMFLKVIGARKVKGSDIAGTSSKKIKSLLSHYVETERPASKSRIC